MSRVVTGVDVSSWQHPEGAPIDWEALADAGVRFAIIKATQGTAYLNPWLARDLDDARAAGLLVGAYHYYEAGVAAGAQAEAFMAQLMGQHLELGAWLDWECYAPAQFTYSQELAEWFEGADKARPGCGLYVDGSWLEALKGNDVLKRRLWVVGDASAEGARVVMRQLLTPSQFGLGGVWFDEDILVSTRGVDLITAPTPRPSAATTRPVRLPPEPGPAPEPAPVAEGHNDLVGGAP